MNEMKIPERNIYDPPELISWIIFSITSSFIDEYHIVYSVISKLHTYPIYLKMCRKKYIKIKEEYQKQDNELEKQRKILFDKYKEKLKNIGLNY